MSDASGTLRAGGALAFILAAVLLVGCGGGDGDLGEPASALAADPLLTEGCRERGGYCGMLTPGGQLTAAAWLDEHRMYLADLEGRIRLLDVRTGELWTVRTGLSMPQGLTVLHDRLYVSDLGNVCQGMLKEKERLEAAGMVVNAPCNLVVEKQIPDALWEHLRKYTARIFSYRVDEKGYLGGEQLIVDRITAVDREHSPNGLTNDGENVYAAIGHPHSYLEDHIDRLHDLALRTDLMGVIARIDSVDRVSVYARGFRNVYGISVAPDGTIYGADNDNKDGLQASGHLEELNAIREGEFYGFPAYGTNEAPHGENVTEPVAILQGSVSTTTHANVEGVYVAYFHIDENPKYVVDRFDYETFTPARIYEAENLVTAILEQDGLLYLVTFDGNIHVIDPNAAPVPFGMRLSSDELHRIRSSDPLIRSEYSVYLDDSRVIYIRESCTGEKKSFNLHIIPIQQHALPPEIREYGFENLDFSFDRYGWIEDDMCIAFRFLPAYDIHEIFVGQYILKEEGKEATFETVWSERLYLPLIELISGDLDRILESDPVIRSEYDVYLDGSRVIFIKESCTEEAKSFSLQVYPVDIDAIPEDRHEHGFENLDFAFDEYGSVADGRCIALRYLPSYDIDFLTTGQYILREADGEATFETVWVEELSFRE